MTHLQPRIRPTNSKREKSIRIAPESLKALTLAGICMTRIPSMARRRTCFARATWVRARTQMRVTGDSSQTSRPCKKILCCHLYHGTGLERENGGGFWEFLLSESADCYLGKSLICNSRSEKNFMV